jgi:hypothetical protein
MICMPHMRGPPVVTRPDSAEGATIIGSGWPPAGHGEHTRFQALLGGFVEADWADQVVSADLTAVDRGEGGVGLCLLSQSCAWWPA